jgi:glycosyltransferase involved in cell wall biosynthesis
MSSVDVIVPCYCYGHFLRECVESVLTQSYSRVRVLIIDDASTDGSAEMAHRLAQEDKRVTVLTHSINRGHILTYNEGIEWSAGEYLLLLSADDYLLPDALQRAVHVFESHPEVGMVMGKAIELSDGHKPPKSNADGYPTQVPKYRIMSGRQFIEFSGSRNRVPTPTAVVRAKLQKQLGGYRPELPHTGDMEMWLRFAANGSIGILDAYQAVYRRHSSNMSVSYRTDFGLPELKQRQAALECFYRTCGPMRPTANLRGRIARELSLDGISCASGAFNQGNMRASATISSFAVAVYPGVKRSWRWAKLIFKRLIGFRAWCAIRRVVAIMPGSVE